MSQAEQSPIVLGDKLDARRASAAAIALLLLVGLTYANSLHGVFVYDDVPAIPGNPTIRTFASAWHPPPGLTVSGRPLLNLSFALNYALSENHVWSYHLGNILIHAAAATALFGVVRRSLLRPRLRPRFGPDSTLIALLSAAVWAVHPLQTEAVDYIVQRTESLMGLFYLATLYCFIRMLSSRRPRRWAWLSVGASALGMATKEVMVTGPLLVLLYDRVLVGETWAGVWRHRRGYYIGLFSTWSILAFSLLSTGGNRNGTKGFDIGVTWASYALTQVVALVHYLELVIWPSVLAFNYAPFWVAWPQILWPAVVLASLAALMGAVSMRRPAVGFCSVWTLALLAPASLVPGTGQMIVEHRMYLALAGIIVPLVCGVYRVLGRRMFYIFLPVTAALAGRTLARNQDYRSELELWGSSVAAQPADPVSHCNFGIALAQAGRIPEAVAQYHAALASAPHYPEAHYNLGVALARSGKRDQAVAEYREAVRERANFPRAHANLGTLALEAGNPREAVAEYRLSLAQADDAEVRGNLANAFYQTGNAAEATAQYLRALQAQPNSPEIHYNYGTTLLQQGDFGAAIREYRTALARGATDADTHYNLALAYDAIGERGAAVEELSATLQINPRYPGAEQQLRRLRP